MSSNPNESITMPISTPWGPARTVLYGNRNKTRAMVWAEEGHGFMIAEDDIRPQEKQRAKKYNNRYWIPGIRQK